MPTVGRGICKSALPTQFPFHPVPCYLQIVRFMAGPYPPVHVFDSRGRASPDARHPTFPRRSCAGISMCLTEGRTKESLSGLKNKILFSEYSPSVRQ